jgi:hypothetical protein
MRAQDGAEAIVLRWARAYTHGLPSGAVERRLGELASDCHEQRRWGAEVGASPAAVATSLVARTLAGMPADLLWRSHQLATARDRSPVTEGRSMRWLRNYWWVVLAGLVGVLLMVMGIGLPIEDRTLGAWLGGAVHLALGATMLLGIQVRRTRRQRGDVMIAVGTLALMPWLWTIVLPVAGLLVMIPALIDAADATAAGPPGPASAGDDQRGVDHLLPVLLAILVAAVVAAIVISEPTPAVVLVSPALGLLFAHLLLRQMRTATTLRLGATLVASVFIHGALLMAAVVISQDSLELGGAWGQVVNYLVSAVGIVGLGLVAAGWASTRRQARPA